MDFIGAMQSITTLVPLVLLWIVALWGYDYSPWLTVAATIAITLFLVRVFALMHECGHGSLFRSPWANRAMGFVFGVISGMPQYVWSQHHDYHHRNNGNWERYRGPLSTLSVDEYIALSPAMRRRYWLARHIALAPLGGFVYLIFNPRFNLLKGNLALLWHLLRGKPAAAFATRYWKTWKEYRHMTANNVVLLGALTAMCLAAGTALVLTVFITSLSVAGGVGIMLFTVQHNFEDSYADNSGHLEPGPGRHDRHQLPGVARMDELVHGEHRLSSRASPVGGHSQLSTRGLPSRQPGPVCRHSAHQALAGSRFPEVPALGPRNPAHHSR